MPSFRIIAIVLLVWNLIGIAAFAMQASADLDALAQTDPLTAQAFRAMPWWGWFAYGAAVATGTAASIALLLRRRAATALFAVSLVALVVQFSWTFLGFDLVAKKGLSTAAFPALISAITLAALLYARAKTRDGTLR